MSDKQAALDELDREFNSSGEMTVGVYAARKRLIESKTDDPWPETKSVQPNGASRGVSWKGLNHVMEKLTDVVLNRFKTDADRIAELERRITKLEEKHLKYQGVHRENETYLGNDLVTWHGSLWICVVLSTKEKPGTDDWRMMTKSR